MVDLEGLNNYFVTISEKILSGFQYQHTLHQHKEKVLWLREFEQEREDRSTVDRTRTSKKLGKYGGKKGIGEESQMVLEGYLKNRVLLGK